MITLSVALDSSRTRDITLYAGDDASINVIVYARDGDRTPISSGLITNMAVTYVPGPNGQNTLNANDFTADFCFRTAYVITASVNGYRTTLAQGIFVAPGYVEPTCGFTDYGWWIWGYRPEIVPNGDFTDDSLVVTYDGGLISYQ